MSGGDPKKFFEFERKPPTQLVPYDKDWYFVANYAAFARSGPAKVPSAIPR